MRTFSLIGVRPIGESREMDDGIGIGFFGNQVGDPLQLEEIVDRSIPGVGDRSLAYVRLIPDYPMIDATLIAGYRFPYEGGP